MKYRGNEKEWERARGLRRHFGITVEEYTRMEAEQKGVCKICCKPEPSGKRLAIDHDHKTGKIRGLLCWNCNTGCGKFKESADLLEQAARYLRGTHGEEL